FAVPGFESRHNLIYWDNESYIGAGAGAHGYVKGIRYSNAGPLKKYMEPLQGGSRPVFSEHTVPLHEQMEEELFLGLRKTAGVSIAHFNKKFGKPMQEIYGEILAKEQGKGNLA